MSSLTPIGDNGLQEVTPTPTGAGGAALNANFEAINTALDAKAAASDLTTHAALTTTAHGGIVPSARTVSTTAPLSGGGALSSNLTLTISAATSGAAGSMSAADKAKLDAISGSGDISAKADKVSSATANDFAGLDINGNLIDSGHKHADYALATHTHAESDVTGLVADLAAKVPTTRTISTTAPLSGGGALSSNLTLTISAATSLAAGSMSASDKAKLDAFSGSGNVNDAANLTTGTLAAARLPLPTSSTLGGVESLAAVSHKFVTSIGTDGIPVAAQPAAGDVSGLAASATTDTTNATNISSGTLADARLSSNVPLKNTANTFTSAQTMNSSLTLDGNGAGSISAAYNATPDASGFIVGTDGALNSRVASGASMLARFQTNATGLGFFGATPIAKPGATTDIRTALINLGLYTTGGASPLDLNGGALTCAALSATTISGSRATLSTGSIISSLPVVDGSQTWNASGTTFTALKLNITNTASAAGSLLADLQVAATSRFSVDKNGNLTLNAASSTTSAPRLFSTTTFNPGEAARLNFGIDMGFQGGYGVNPQIYGYHGLDVQCGAQSLSPPSFNTGTNGLYALKCWGAFVVTTRSVAGVSALTDATTIALDSSLGNIFTVTLGGNRTMGNPSNSTDGHIIRIRLKQDGTGSRTVTWSANFRFSGGTAPTLTTTINKTDYITFIYNGTDSKWDCIGTTLNL